MKGKKWLLCIILCLAIVIGGLCIIAGNRSGFANKNELPKWTDPAFESGEFEGVFCMMDGSSYFSEEDFLTYRGLHIVKSDKMLEGFSHIGDMLELILTQNKEINSIYMQINPMDLWEEVQEEGKWEKYLKKYFTDIMSSNKEVTFEILLSYPQITYYTNMEERELENCINVYQSFVDAFESLDNVWIYYLGGEQWLNSNPDNYESSFKVNEEIEKHIYLSVFCDRKYVANAAFMEQKLQNLQVQIDEFKKTEYPNWNEYSIVFFGDSIIGMDRSTCSIPGVISALTAARTYNCAKSGSAATYDENAEFSFIEVVDAVIARNTSALTDEEVANGIDLFLQDSVSEEKLLFVINYGLNDYFIGYPVEEKDNLTGMNTYTGALKMGIERLQEVYPQAEFIIMIPTYTINFEEGTQIMSPQGDVLAKYRDAAKRVAEEMGIHYKDNYNDIKMDASNEAEFLVDGCHLNDWGKYVMGTQLIHFLEKEVMK